MAAKKKKCFVLMPFKTCFDSVYLTIKKTAESCGYQCWRADEKCVSGNVVRQILDDISASDAIIADLTGRNPNVFYETAIAHERKKDNQVILIAQKDKDVPFDLQALRYLKYGIKTSAEKRQFGISLRKFLEEAIDENASSLVEIIEGANERTRRIVAEFNSQMEHCADGNESSSVLVQSALSILSISTKEVESETDPLKRAHKELIMGEKMATMELIRKRAKYRVILNPPTEKADGFDLSYLDYRYKEMLRLLEPKTGLLPEFCGNCCDVEFVISPIRQNNLLVISDKVCFEGRKSGFLSGYDLTTRISDKLVIRSLRKSFNDLYNDAKKYTFLKYARNKRAVHDKNVLQEAVYNGLYDLYEKYKANFEK